MMEEIGFPSKFVGLIMACVTSVSYSILLNGKPMAPFQAAKGLWQEDPLFPYLFAIAMEYLSRLMSQIREGEGFRFHPKCKKLSITHLMFAEDPLLFSRADLASTKVLKEKFEAFVAASGLRANTSNETQQAISQFLQIPIESLHFRYFGVPLSSRKLSYMQCKPLLEAISQRISSLDY